MRLEITPDLAHKLGHYVYAYVDPRDNSVFYIGKGIGPRATAHLEDKQESRKVARIKSVREQGLEPRIDIIAYGLRDDAEACRVEAALIELVGVHNLTNAVRGLGTTNFPRRPLCDLIIECAPERAEITDPSLLIRINKQFEYGMTELALYESTRGVWVIGKRRKRAKLAMAVYAGIIREVYEIESWHPAGSTLYLTRDAKKLARKKRTRWEFVGHVAPATVRDRYLGRSVAHLFKQGQQSPTVGVGLD